ncbi:hypothetical protein ZIOFF_066111 [Zingiber officinale]|uniref:Uncharacterized protein n=1 Tax=Zingiber officinale TaxID=94328 RepID=A0A8J5F290_ZINOF|nr:hypothetical protein ZIOFF_066111 [Zingiber officinale]
MDFEQLDRYGNRRGYQGAGTSQVPDRSNKVVTGIALPSGSDKLYSCSKDESVRVWDTQTGKCVGAINMGGEVGCMTSEGPWLFIGVVNAVKVRALRICYHHVI